MKTIKNITLSILLLSTFIINAQFRENNTISLEFKNNFGNYKGLNVSINYSYKKYSLQINEGTYSRKPDQLPDDYHSSLGTPSEFVRSHELLVGRIVKLEGNNMIRFNLKAGISYSQSETPVDFFKKEPNFWTGENYCYMMLTDASFGLIINPGIEIAVFQYVGVSLSPYANFNKNRNIYGAQLGLLIGILRSRNTK